jgi:galactokinase
VHHVSAGLLVPVGVVDRHRVSMQQRACWSLLLRGLQLQHRVTVSGRDVQRRQRHVVHELQRRLRVFRGLRHRDAAAVWR